MTVTDEEIDELLRWARRDALTASNGDNLTKLADALAALKAERAELQVAQLQNHNYLDAAEKRLCGTSLIISSVVRATIGIMIRARAMPPANA